MPDAFLRAVAGLHAAAARRATASRVCFLPQTRLAPRLELEQLLEETVEAEGQTRARLARRAGRRAGTSARRRGSSRRSIRQLFVGASAELADDATRSSASCT